MNTYLDSNVSQYHIFIWIELKRLGCVWSGYDMLGEVRLSLGRCGYAFTALVWLGLVRFREILQAWLGLVRFGKLLGG